MTTKIKRGSEYSTYINGLDGSLAPEAIVAELVDSELFLNESVDPVESALTGGAVIPLTQGLDWGTIFNLYVLNTPCRLWVLLDNIGTGEFKEYFFLMEAGSNKVALFEPTLQPDQMSLTLLPMAVEADLEFTFELIGSASPNAYLGA